MINIVTTGCSVGHSPESSVITAGGKDTDMDGTTTVAKAYLLNRKWYSKDTLRIP